LLINTESFFICLPSAPFRVTNKKKRLPKARPGSWEIDFQRKFYSAGARPYFDTYRQIEIIVSK